MRSRLTSPNTNRQAPATPATPATIRRRISSLQASRPYCGLRSDPHSSVPTVAGNRSSTAASTTARNPIINAAVRSGDEVVVASKCLLRNARITVERPSMAQPTFPPLSPAEYWYQIVPTQEWFSTVPEDLAPGHPDRWTSTHKRGTDHRYTRGAESPDN